MNRVHLAFDTVMLKQRNFVLVLLDLFHMAWNQHLDMITRSFMGFFAFDQNFFNFAGINITDRAFDKIAFFMNDARRL